MPEKLLISIITVNLNDVEGLKRTMTSVFEQTWQEFEYIVIDGGSTDGSKEYIEQHSDRIDFWVSEKDSGIYNAMNKGIKAATGKYLLFLNSGDHLFEDTILEQNNQFLMTYDLVYFNLNVVGPENTFVKYYPDKLCFSYFIKDTLPHPATFIKVTLFEKIGFYDEDLKIVSDWKFFIESICKFNASYNRIDEILATFYLDGLSSYPENSEIIHEEKMKVLKSNFNVFQKDNNRLNELESLISNLRKSKKIKLLVKLGLLNKF